MTSIACTFAISLKNDSRLELSAKKSCVLNEEVSGSRFLSLKRTSSKRCKSIRSSFSENVKNSESISEENIPRLDVSSNCVNPVFRSIPKQQEKDSKVVRVLFLSEGNVCRSLYAEAAFQELIQSNSLSEDISCYSKATRDYNLGEEADSRAASIAKEVNLKLREGAKASMFEPAKDIVDYDIVIVMDKFNAADALKEVSVFDTIDSSANYSSKVRRLGDFAKNRVIEDIDDPLYGNMGGSDELDLLRSVASDISESCNGLFEDLITIKSSLKDGESWREGISNWLLQMKALDWLVPPMLQKR